MECAYYFDFCRLCPINTAMILRQIYADSPEQGQVVWNMGARANEAADEIDRLSPSHRIHAHARRLF